MKNYKAEIEKIIDEKWIEVGAIHSQGREVTHADLDDIRNKEKNEILSLFREIAKEAVGEMKKEGKHDGHSTDDDLYCYTCEESIKEGTCTSATHDNSIRSEILSNIEKVMK